MRAGRSLGGGNITFVNSLSFTVTGQPGGGVGGFGRPASPRLGRST